MELIKSYLTREKRKSRIKEEVSVNTKIRKVKKLWGILNCFEIETDEGKLYKTVGDWVENKRLFEFAEKNLEKPVEIWYKKLDVRYSDWLLRLDGFLYCFGWCARKLGGKGDYGMPRRYLEIEKIELLEDVAERFRGIYI